MAPWRLVMNRISIDLDNCYGICACILSLVLAVMAVVTGDHPGT